MPFIKVLEKIPGDTIRGRMGFPNGFGWLTFGWSRFGDDNYYQGVYQIRHHREYDGVGGFNIEKKQNQFYMKPAWPIQPPSTARDAQQNKFKTALSAWQALTDEEKAGYNKIASRSSRRGYDYFMSKKLKSL